jgi:hypothetical protein
MHFWSSLVHTRFQSPTTKRLALRSALGTERLPLSLSSFLSFCLCSICLLSLHFCLTFCVPVEPKLLHLFDRHTSNTVIASRKTAKDSFFLFFIGGSYMRMASETKRQNVGNKTPIALPNSAPTQPVANTVSLEAALSGAIGARYALLPHLTQHFNIY